MAETTPRAADLPAGSIVVDDNRSLVWRARHEPGVVGRWRVSGTHTLIQDREIDAAMSYTARVLRVGDGSER